MESIGYVGDGWQAAGFYGKTKMSQNNSLLAVYNAHSDAAAGISELQRAGFEISRVSIAGKLKDSETNGSGSLRPGEQTGRSQTIRITSRYPMIILTESASVDVAGIGPTLLTGPLAALIVASPERTEVLEMRVLSAGLYSLGIPPCTIRRHESSLRAEKVLLLAGGTAAELMSLKDILHNSRPEEVSLHFGRELVMSQA
jgi:hypothetical protein